MIYLFRPGTAAAGCTLPAPKGPNGRFVDNSEFFGLLAAR